MLATHACEYIKTNLKNYPGNYLEIGVYEGDGLATIACEYSDKKIFGLDPFIEDGCTQWLTHVETGKELARQRDLTMQNIAGLDNIQLFEMTSIDFANNLTDQQVKEYNVDVIFIDGSHQFADVTNDWRLALRLLSGKEGLILFDDTNLSGVIAAIKLFEEALINTDIEYIELKPNCLIVKVNLQ